MRQLWILVALVGCKSGSDGGGGSFGNSRPVTDWSDKKLVEQEGSVDGIAFTLEIPEGLPRDKRDTGAWDDPDPKYDHAPKVFTQTIEIARVQDMKQAKYHATLDAAQKTWVREQSRPTSWALTYAEPDKTRIEAITYWQANDQLFVKCKAVQASGDNGGPLPSYKKTLAMLEGICDGLKIKGEAPPAEDTPEPVEKAPDMPDEKPDEKSDEAKPAQGGEGGEGGEGVDRLKKAASGGATE